ncbi:7506_t:CDS:2, partial [Cetraspora pellucida]
MPQNNLSININTLNAEQRCQFFIELFDLDPTLPNALNHEQCHQLHSVLIAIEPSLVESLLDARSAVRGIANKQFPRGFTMNPIKLSEYESYKESQKRIKKDVQWNEFLKLDKKQYLNFRNDLRNRAASRFLRGISLTRQPKGKAEEVIKEFNKANSTFPVSEADFVLRDWLASYCNSMGMRNTNYIDVKSIHDQSNTDEMSDNAQDSFESDDNINDNNHIGNTDESVEPDALTTAKQVTVISEDDQDNIDESVLEPDALTTASSAFSRADIDDQDNINESVLEPDALTTASSAFSHADIGQENTSTLVKNKSKKRNSAPMRPRSTNIKVNDHRNEQSTVIPKNNMSPLPRNNLRSSARKFNNIETVLKRVKDGAQDS